MSETPGESTLKLIAEHLGSRARDVARVVESGQCQCQQARELVKKNRYAQRRVFPVKEGIISDSGETTPRFQNRSPLSYNAQYYIVNLTKSFTGMGMDTQKTKSDRLKSL